MVEISGEELKQLLEGQKKMANEMEEMRQALKDAGKEGVRRTKKVKHHTAKVMTVDNKVVVGFVNKGSSTRPLYVYERQDPNDKNKRINFVDLKFEDGNIMQVPHKEFLDEAQRVTCKILRFDESEWTVSDGVTKKKKVEGYKTVELDEDVEMEVVGRTRVYTLELPEELGSREVSISDKYLNM